MTIPTTRLRMPDARTAVVQVTVPVGASSDPARMAGLAHATEHLILRSGDRSDPSQSLEFQAQRMGGWLGGVTYPYETAFRLIVLPEHREWAEEFLPRAVFGFIADQSDWEIERLIMDDEIGEDNREYESDRTLWRVLGGTANGFPRDSAGTPGSISRIQSADIRRFWSRHYDAARCSLLSIGPDSGDDWQAYRFPEPALEKLPVFGAWKQRPTLRVLRRTDWGSAEIDLNFLNGEWLPARDNLQIELMCLVLEDELYERLSHGTGFARRVTCRPRYGPAGVIVAVTAQSDRAARVLQLAIETAIGGFEWTEEKVSAAGARRKREMLLTCGDPYEFACSLAEVPRRSWGEEFEAMDQAHRNPSAVLSALTASAKRLLTADACCIILAGDLARKQRGEVEAVAATLRR